MKGLLLSHILPWRTKSVWIWYAWCILLGLMNFTIDIFLDNSSLIGIMLLSCTASLCGGVMMFGERYNWNKYIITLPVSRKQIIICQHIETAAYEVCIYLALLLSAIAATIWRGRDIAETIYIVMIIALAAITISVSHIISAAFGGRTGQKCGMIFIMLCFIAVMIISHFYPTECAIYLIIVAIIIKAVSIPVSVRLYSKRDL
ncbi:MAG: ABC-2 transporter permease [Oscillospiraceae bacterium]|nr:ABC-2 transporter permease [Oscillospiraceae bacterium]